MKKYLYFRKGYNIDFTWAWPHNPKLIALENKSLGNIVFFDLWSLNILKQKGKHSAANSWKLFFLVTFCSLLEVSTQIIWGSVTIFNPKN